MYFWRRFLSETFPKIYFMFEKTMILLKILLPLLINELVVNVIISNQSLNSYTHKHVNIKTIILLLLMGMNTSPNENLKIALNPNYNPARTFF